MRVDTLSTAIVVPQPRATQAPRSFVGEGYASISMSSWGSSPRIRTGSAFASYPVDGWSSARLPGSRVTNFSYEITRPNVSSSV